MLMLIRKRQAEDVLHANWIQTGRTTQQRLESAAFGESYISVGSLDGLAEPVDGSHPPTIIPFYRNVTGSVRGEWIRSEVTEGFQPPVLNVSAISSVPYASTQYDRNISGERGHLTIKFNEKNADSVRLGSANARAIMAEMTIQDERSSGDGWELTLHGVHYLESGAVLLSTSSDKFAGIFSQPHFARSGSCFRLAQVLLNQTLAAAITKQEHFPFPWASSRRSPAEVAYPTPHCEYIIFLQQHFVWPYKPTTTSPESRWPKLHGKDPLYLEKIEHELRLPTGATLEFLPDLKFSALVFSPDCGFALESKPSGPGSSNHLIGLKIETYHIMIRQAVELFSIFIAVQIYLLIRQMKDASTPSTRSRVSYYTVAIMALGDGFVFLSFMALSLFTDVTFLMIISAAFLAFLSVSFFGMKFLMDVYTVQAPERQSSSFSSRRRRGREVHPLPTTTPTGGGLASTDARNTSTLVTIIGESQSLPLPATSFVPQDGSVAPITTSPPDQDIEGDGPQNALLNNATSPLGSARREVGAFYSRFYFLLIGIVFLSLNATTWPMRIRTVYRNFLLCLYLSFWTPQIVRNVKRNCRKALRWDFVVGQSILRLLPLVYFYTNEGNVLFMTKDTYTLYFLVGWVWAQVLTLTSQEVFGPRFLVPDGWAPPAYDYHPVLREDDEEAGTTLPMGLTQQVSEIGPSVVSGEIKGRGKRLFDCAICMHNIDVSTIPASAAEHRSWVSPSPGSNIFNRRNYMVTPCRHIFHSVCLEGWMRYKLQCPICRDSLPPT